MPPNAQYSRRDLDTAACREHWLSTVPRSTVEGSQSRWQVGRHANQETLIQSGFAVNPGGHTSECGIGEEGGMLLCVWEEGEAIRNGDELLFLDMAHHTQMRLSTTINLHTLRRVHSCFFCE